MKIFEMIVKCGLANSNREAKRLMKSGAVKINNIPITDVEAEVISIENKVVIGWIIDDIIVLHKCMEKQT